MATYDLLGAMNESLEKLAHLPSPATVIEVPRWFERSVTTAVAAAMPGVSFPQAFGIRLAVDESMPDNRFAVEYADGRREVFWLCCGELARGLHAPDCCRRPRPVR